MEGDERIHAGEDRDTPTMDDVRRDDRQEEARAESLFAEEYEVERPTAQTTHQPEAVGSSCCRWCETAFDDRVEHRKHTCPDRSKWERLWAFEPDDEALIEPQVHEVGAKLLFDGQSDGMEPYFAIVSQFDECYDGLGSFEAADETWHLNHDEEKVKYWEGQIATREEDAGDAYYEYNIGVVADDPVGRKRVNFQFRPSLPEATNVDSGERIESMPADLPEGLRVQVDSANVEREAILDVLQGLADAMGISTHYFRESRLHDWSRVYNYAQYVRVLRSISERRLVNQTGLLERLASFTSQRPGRGEYKWDNEEIMGHRNAVTLNETSLSKLLPEQSVGKVSKVYHMKNPEATADPDEPTTHPKFEVQYSTEYSEEKSIPWADADDLESELDEYLLCQLDWADLVPKADAEWVVPDEYWEPEDTDRDVTVYPDPLHDLQEVEEGVAIHHMVNEDASPGERSVLQALADGGQMHYDELADASDTSSSTVYRAADRFSDVIERAQGVFEFADDVIREKFEELFGYLEDAADWVDRGIEHVQDSEKVIAGDSPLASWARRYGASISEGREALDVDFQAGVYSKYEIQKILRAGYSAARQTGSVAADKMLKATVRYQDRDDGEFRGRAFAIQGNSISVLGANVLSLG
ncbi:hypothetical protein BV210_02590 [Halorientalis sp. IM1011]|uniref:DUF7845 domain-containing protein n=1 Tax=Halorientalis sp. IM1011 TaxID=1932360 RepID=UPI00097CCE9B|nr:hypothetical protein [Halorientalis sp. IM1011]AQL41669.1 hypothetical protein BV210_02590 [Halorientalis sp. IM1011]